MDSIETQLGSYFERKNLKMLIECVYQTTTSQEVKNTSIYKRVL